MSKLNRAGFSTVVLAAFSTMAAVGCSAAPSDSSAVSPKVELVNRSTQALSAGSIQSVNGTYGAGCTQRSGSWSVAVDGSIDALDNAPLSVVKNNTQCELNVTELHAASLYEGTPSIDMSTSFQPAGSSFAVALADGGSAPIAFYANAKLSSVGFGSDFTIDIVYSDDPNLVGASKNTTYATQSSTASSSQTPAPDYSLDLSAMFIQADNAAVEQSASGEADLTDGATTGQTYMVDSDTLPSSPTFADVDGFWTAHTAVALSGSNPAIGVSAFSLGGVTLPVVRTLIVANERSGTRSYQLFKITFNAP